MGEPGDNFRDAAKAVALTKNDVFTHRDKFAMHALEGLLAQQTNSLISHVDDLDKKLSYLNGMTITEAYVNIAYRFADAMMIERKKKSE